MSEHDESRQCGPGCIRHFLFGPVRARTPEACVRGLVLAFLALAAGGAMALALFGYLFFSGTATLWPLAAGILAVILVGACFLVRPR